MGLSVQGSLYRALALAAMTGAAAAQGAQPASPAAPAAKPQPAVPATPATPAKPGEAAKPATVDGWSGEVATNKDAGGIALDEAQTKAVKTVSDYFGKLDSVKGEFVQVGADNKRMRGKFYVKRPGRFRFDYALPSKQVIISDGRSLAIQDHDLNNEDRVELDQTPFRLLLRADVDLLRDARIVEVQEATDMIVVALQDKSPDTPGKIKVFLSTKPEVALKEWVTTDAQGLDTRVEVTDLVKAEDLDANLFKIQMLGAHRTTPQ